MVWSPSEDQSQDSGEWLQTMCESFAEENSQWDITFVYGVADEATAASQVSQDPERTGCALRKRGKAGIRRAVESGENRNGGGCGSRRQGTYRITG